MKKPPTPKNLFFVFLLFISTKILAAPGNDNCANATLITPATSYINGTNLLTGQTISAATVEGTGVTTTCGSMGSQDVWYKFVASSEYPIITVSNLGSNWGTSLRIQLLSGTCGSFTQVNCVVNAPLTPTSALVPGNTYYVRIFRNSTTGPTGANWGFDISIIGGSSRMAEVFQTTTLSAANVLNDPWEITYGPDNFLWITESKGYKVYRMDPSTGTKTTILDISNGSTFLPSPADSLNVQFTTAQNPWPQGGLAGLALHPKFLDPVTPKNYVYISYIHRFLGGTSPSGLFYRNKLVRFTYNTGTGLLGNPVVLCDTLPGSKDHNSQRIIIAPITHGGTYYLFYGEGDMGSGQFENRTRANKAQNVNSYEGKILRFNLESDGDAGGDAWIPNGNPYSSSSAVYSMGIRNNQGFAYDTALNILYGSSHGPFSDDEINIIESGKNYGHPLVIGKADGNANGTTAGSAPNMSGGSTSSCPVITDEVAAAAALPNYKDPLFSGYPSSTAFPLLKDLWDNTTGTNGQWPSEAWSGLDLYTNTLIPGWKHSLVAASLKWGRLVRIKLDAAGTATAPTNTVADTISYFGSTNRYRDIAFAPNGKDVYVIMDKSATTSGPSAQNPIVPACPGCVQKYTFLGYADAGGKSTIPTSIDVTDATVNTVDSATQITINSANSNLWVPITGPDGNIMAEIYPNGNSLGIVRSAFYKNSGSIRIKSGVHYLDRNITITPTNAPAVGSPVKIRLYISKTEYNALDADGLSSVNAITDLRVLKNSDACGSAISSNTTLITPAFWEAHGANGYMIQIDNITGFSSFYFGASNVILPLRLISFTGTLQQNNSALLKWKTENEINTSHFVVERSIDGTNFSAIGNVKASGIASTVSDYSYVDNDANHQQSSVVYYRLRITDIDNAFTYSNIVTIELPDITSVVVSPNPVIHEANVSITAITKGRLQWSLLDNNGRVIMQNSAHLNRGTNSLIINMDGVSAGSYYLNLSGAGINRNVKIQKL